MPKISLQIENPRESRNITLDGELTIGRTNNADIVIDDVGLSRVNTTFFRDGEMIYAIDENSTNGTFVNGEKIGNAPRRIYDGDVLKIGSETRIKVFTNKERSKKEATIDFQDQTKLPKDKKQNANDETKNKKTKNENRKPNKPPLALLLAAGMTFVFIAVAAIAIILVKRYEDTAENTNGKKPPKVLIGAVIPIRVIDPLGGQTPEDLQDLTQLWEVQEKEVEATDLEDVTASAPTDSKSSDAAPATDLKVSVAFWQQQRAKALEARNSPTGNDPPGQQIPREVFGDGVVKQKAKIAEMMREGYQQPMDFADLAQKKMSGELVELPMATEDYVLEVGGSSGGEEFTAFNFAAGNVPIAPGSEKFNILQKLASNFSGEKYDINNSDHRKQMRIRMLRMFHPRAKPVLEKLAKDYRLKFNRPLRVTSLSRSMDYQISLNKMNPNSFKVRGAGSLPPHTSGCTFDLARKHMTAEEQNFVMADLAQMERDGLLDALREGNLNACFHVFIYDDGQPPKM